MVIGKENGGFHPPKGGSNLHPWGEWNIRAIPGSHRYLATAAPHHGVAFGSLIQIDTRIEDDGMMAHVKRVTPDCLFPEGEMDPSLAEGVVPEDLWLGWAGRVKNYYLTGKYGTARPLNEDFYICNYWKYIILLDRFGNKEVLYTVKDDAEDFRLGFRSIDLMPLRPRKKPPVLAQRTYDGEDSRSRGSRRNL